jgi:hypothetical protein
MPDRTGHGYMDSEDLNDVAPRVKKEFIPPDLFIPISGTYSACSVRWVTGLNNGCNFLISG